MSSTVPSVSEQAVTLLLYAMVICDKYVDLNPTSKALLRIQMTVILSFIRVEWNRKVTCAGRKFV